MPNFEIYEEGKVIQKNEKFPYITSHSFFLLY